MSLFQFTYISGFTSRFKLVSGTKIVDCTDSGIFIVIVCTVFGLDSILWFCCIWENNACFLVKPLSQRLHRCGNSPVCIATSWFFKFPFVPNRLLQYVHENGFNPSWTAFTWASNLDLVVRSLPQVSHVNLKRKEFKNWH